MGKFLDKLGESFDRINKNLEGNSNTEEVISYVDQNSDIARYYEKKYKDDYKEKDLSPVNKIEIVAIRQMNLNPLSAYKTIEDVYIELDTVISSYNRLVRNYLNLVDNCDELVSYNDLLKEKNEILKGSNYDLKIKYHDDMKEKDREIESLEYSFSNLERNYRKTKRELDDVLDEL